MRLRHHTITGLSVVGIWFFGWTFAHAQQINEIKPPDVLRADIDNTDVYLNDSFEASDALFHVQSLIRRNRWSDAAALLQTTSDRFGRKLIRVAPGHYTGLQEHINNLIADWPAKGITAYRMLYERELQNALSSLTSKYDVSRLLPLLDRYFCTAVAGELADTIGQLAIESGDLALAEHVYRRVLDHHPDADVHVEQYRARLMIIAAMQNHRSHISSADQQIQILWMGKQRKLVDVFSHIRKTFQPVRYRVNPHDWPIFGGNDVRNRLASTQVDELGLLWRFSMKEKSGSATGDTGSDSPASDQRQSRNLIMQPVVSSGLVFVQRLREIVALRLNTGEVVWRYHSYDRPPDIDYFEDHPAGWDAATVYDGRVYASLPGDAMPYYSYDSSRSPHELICLDAQNGRMLWQLSQNDFDDRFSEIHFDSSPIVHQGQLYIVGRRRRSFGFEDCYLFRINASTGKVEAQTHLGSASTGSFGSHPATKAAAALHGDTVYVCSNLGSVAAVSAHTGIVRWLRLYERLRDGSGVVTSRITTDANPWRFQPVIWTDDQIVIWPTDASNVMVLSTDDGRLLKSLPADSIGGMEMLLGLHDHLLCGAGRHIACYDLEKEVLRWSKTLPDQAKLFGRGAWVDDRLLIPTTQGLSTYQLEDGQRTDIPWSSDTRGGNLLPMPDYILVTDHQSVSAYVRRADIWKALGDRMAASPTDPIPALEMAEVALRSGEIKDALYALQEADRRANLDQQILEAPLQTRIFKDALSFADVLSERSVLQEDVLDDLFYLAAQYAPDTVSNLQYRLRFSLLYESSNKPGRAMRLYQQILQDRTLRALPIHAKSTASPRAAVEAQDRIAALIERHGRSIYKPYETRASQWLESSREAQDVSILVNVVETFPNSLAAPRAMIAHGELLAKRDRPIEAAAMFAAAYHRYAKELDRPNLLRKIADAYEHAGRVEHAYRWLSKAANEHPGVFFEHNGRRITFLQYRERLADVRHKIEPVRPEITLPLDHHYEKTYEQKVTLLKPRFVNNPASRWSQFYIYTQGRIAAIIPKNGKERWNQPAEINTPAELLVATDNLAVFTTMHKVFALDADNGEKLWELGNDHHNKRDDGADWEADDMLISHALYDDRLISVHNNGMISCISIESGEIHWSRAYHPAPKSTVYVSDPWLVYYFVQKGKVILALVDMATGNRVNIINTDITRPVEAVFATLDGQIVVITSRSLSSFDTESKKQRWHVSLSGPLQRASLLFDLDAVYFSQDRRELRKINLENGRMIWQTEQLLHRGEDDLTVTREGNYLIVSTDTSVHALDPVTGLILWRGTTSQRPRLISRWITQSYVVTVDLEAAQQQNQSVAFFYDHRNASGVIPQGGSVQLGTLEDIRMILAVDGALLIQTGSTIHGYTHP